MRSARITINRPEVRNAFRTKTVEELTDAFVEKRPVDFGKFRT